MERHFCLAMTHESMHIERKPSRTTALESIHALGLKLHNLDQGLSLYPIAKLTKLMPCSILTK